MGFQSFTSFVNTSLSLQQWRMCCSVVHLTRYVAVLGILVSGMCIAPPTYTYLEGRDYSTLMPGLITLQERLLVEYQHSSGFSSPHRVMLPGQMPSTTLVDLVHDGAHHPRLSCCRLLLHPPPAGAGGHVHLAHSAGCLLGPWN